uniref:Uncharacterized protein n=1 Tax=Peronospora matthiolae TaxID=2874970 RepID=A0AAV1U2V0_9STRA
MLRQKETENDARSLEQDPETKLKQLPIRNMMAIEKLLNFVEEDESDQTCCCDREILDAFQEED